MYFWQAQAELAIYQWLLRATVVFLWLLFMTKLMGQREIAQLTLFDFVIAITIGSVAAAPAANPELELSGALTSVGVMAVLNILLAVAALKNSKLRRVVQEEPIVLVQNGQVLRKMLAKTRYNLDDLLTQLRQKNFPNLTDVEYAILESNGKISVIPKAEARPLTAKDMQLVPAYEGLPIIIIEDGNILEDNLRENELSRDWLDKQLAQMNIRPEDVFVAMIDSRRQLYVSAKGASRFSVLPGQTDSN